MKAKEFSVDPFSLKDSNNALKNSGFLNYELYLLALFIEARFKKTNDVDRNKGIVSWGNSFLRKTS